jgi:transcription antitermination factor NusG
MHKLPESSGSREGAAMSDFYSPGDPRWHALIVIPQREHAAEAMLSRHGVYSFHPVTSRTTRVRGKRKTVQSRYLPGYVFARFPGPVIWHRLVASPLIADAVRHSSGWPAVLAAQDLERLHAMRAIDEAEAERQRQARVIRRGDRVRILTGAFEGEEVEVLSLANGAVHVRMCILNTELPVQIVFSGVEKIQPLPETPACGIRGASAAL